VGVDETTGEILAAVVTTNVFHDGEVLSDILEQVEDNLKQVTTDGAYDHSHCDDEIAERKAKAVIPPRKDAVIWQQGNCKALPHPSDLKWQLHSQAWTQEMETGFWPSSSLVSRNYDVSTQSHLWRQAKFPKI
jgi:hypothetical protein